MGLAICIRCGARKARPAERCNSCGLQPGTDEDKAKSLILSVYYEIDGQYRGKSKEELLAIGERIRGGKAEPFDPSEVAAIVRYARQVQSIPRTAWIDLVKWLAPVALMFAALVAMLWSGK